MRRCKLCGQSTGLWRATHKECERRHAAGASEIAAIIERAATQPDPGIDITRAIDDIKRRSWIGDQTADLVVVEAWENEVEIAFSDGVLSEDEENRLQNIVDVLQIPRDVIDRGGSYTKLVKGAILRDILNGIIPQRVKIDGVMPVNLQRGEALVWAFPGVTYIEKKDGKVYVGRSEGVSVRICKGVYWRTGSFRGRSVPYTESTSYFGDLLVTSKHLYFNGVEKSFRVRYDKVLSWEPYSDGIGIMRDAVNAKPQLFVTGDGWFTYNLVTNLAHM